MVTEVLIMCQTCGRPQPPGPVCVQCGVELPAAIEPRAGAAPEASAPPPPAPEAPPAVEPAPAASPPGSLELGGGRSLFLDEDALELRGGPAPQRVPLSQIEAASFARQRVRLFLWGALIGAIASSFVTSVAARGAIAVLAAWQLFMYVRTRQYVLELRLRGGGTLQLPLGQGGPAVGERTLGVYDALAEPLARRGIEVRRPNA
jgi:hypothetical protein